jgi:hypothetical protein
MYALIRGGALDDPRLDAKAQPLGGPRAQLALHAHQTAAPIYAYAR